MNFAYFRISTKIYNRNRSFSYWPGALCINIDALVACYADSAYWCRM